MARKAAPGGQAATRPRFDMTTGAAILATALAVVALPLCLVLAAGLLPTAVAAMVGRNSRRYLVRAVAPTNLAGTVLPALTLFRTDFSFSGAMHVLADPHNWLIMYAAASVGWFLHWAMPQLANVVLTVNANRAEQRLRRRVEHLVAEWGGAIGAGETQPPR
jgi:hypothetical protein